MGDREVVEAYGLHTHPFRAQEPLDPVRRTSDAGILAEIDGWREALPGIATYLAGRADNDGAIVFVHGSSGSGHTSMANHTIEAWRCLTNTRRNDDREFKTILSSKVLTTNHDTLAMLRDWCTEFEFIIGKLEGVNVSSPVQGKFATLGSSEGNSNSLYKVKSLLSSLSIELRAKGFVIAGLIERINNADIVEAAVEIAQAAGMLMVITADTTESTRQSILPRINDFRSDGCILSLSGIKGDEVWTLLERRWRVYTGGIEFPFNKTGLVSAFADTTRPAQRVLRIASALLINKVNEHYAAERWPAGRQLAFDEHEIRPKVVDLEQQIWRES